MQEWDEHPPDVQSVNSDNFGKPQPRWYRTSITPKERIREFHGRNFNPPLAPPGQSPSNPCFRDPNMLCQAKGLPNAHRHRLTIEENVLPFRGRNRIIKALLGPYSCRICRVQAAQNGALHGDTPEPVWRPRMSSDYSVYWHTHTGTSLF